MDTLTSNQIDQDCAKQTVFSSSSSSMESACTFDNVTVSCNANHDIDFFTSNDSLHDDDTSSTDWFALELVCNGQEQKQMTSDDFFHHFVTADKVKMDFQNKDDKEVIIESTIEENISTVSKKRKKCMSPIDNSLQELATNQLPSPDSDLLSKFAVKLM
jgi:hypothetical protein